MNRTCGEFFFLLLLLLFKKKERNRVWMWLGVPRRESREERGGHTSPGLSPRGRGNPYFQSAELHQMAFLCLDLGGFYRTCTCWSLGFINWKSYSFSWLPPWKAHRPSLVPMYMDVCFYFPWGLRRPVGGGDYPCFLRPHSEGFIRARLLLNGS